MSEIHRGNGGSSIGEKFDILSHPVRRRVLVTLDGQNPQQADEFVTNAMKGNGADLERVALMMYHQHLPKLERAGLIGWDRDTETITRGPRYEEIEPLIELLNSHQSELPDDWP